MQQTGLQHENGRLRVDGLMDAGRVFLAPHFLENGPAGYLLELGIGTDQEIGKHRLGVEQLLPHSPPLRSHAAEYEHWLGRAALEPLHMVAGR